MKLRIVTLIATAALCAGLSGCDDKPAQSGSSSPLPIAHITTAPDGTLLGVPVTLVDSPMSQGLVLEGTSLQHGTSYSTMDNYVPFSTSFRNRRALTVTKLAYTIEMLDESGQVVASSDESLPTLPLWPGDEAYTRVRVSAAKAVHFSNVRVTVTANETAPGPTFAFDKQPVGLELEGSRVGIDRLFQKFKKPFIAVTLHNTQPKKEITNIDLVFYLLDASGKVIGAQAVNVPRTLRPDDRFAVSAKFDQAVQNIAGVRVSVKKLETDDAPASYPASKPASVGWSIAQPSGYSFTAAERDRQSAPGLMPGSTKIKTWFEITNTGTQPVDKLSLDWSALDASGKVLKTKRLLIVDEEYDAALPPGKTHIEYATLEVPAGFVKSQLNVVKLQ